MRTLSLALAAACLCAAQAAKIDQVDYLGWKCYRLSNANTQVFVAPEIGGRIIGYSYKGHQFFWTNPASRGKVMNDSMEWIPYGGDKVWPAPQGWEGPDEWPGPGDKQVDMVPFTVEVLQASGSEVSIKLTSTSNGGWAGVAFDRVLTLGDGSDVLKLKTTMRNVKGSPVEWSVWTVAQMIVTDSKGRPNPRLSVYVPINPNSRFPKGYQVMFGQTEVPHWMRHKKEGLFQARFAPMVGKVGLDACEGWSALVDEESGFAFVQRYPKLDPAKRYPIGDSYEVWLNAPGVFYTAGKRNELGDKDPLFLEMEILSPMVRLDAGQMYTWETEYEAMQGGLKDVLRRERGVVR